MPFVLPGRLELIEQLIYGRPIVFHYKTDHRETIECKENKNIRREVSNLLQGSTRKSIIMYVSKNYVSKYVCNSVSCVLAHRVGQ